MIEINQLGVFLAYIEPDLNFSREIAHESAE